MKKNIWTWQILLLIVLFGTLSSCSQDNAVLATSKIKNITRNDFFSWLEAKKVINESMLDSKDKQMEMLKSMALEMFIMDKAEAEGFDKSSRLMARKKRLRERTLKKYFISAVTDMATYNEPVIRVSYILLPLNLYKTDPGDKRKKVKLANNEVAEKFDELSSKAKEIVQRLESGDSFEKLAAEFSDDTTKKNGGDFGYILKGMMPAFFSDAAFSLGAGEYTKTPVMTPKGVYIIKVTDKADVTEKNINQIIEDKNQREKIKLLLIKQYRSEYLSKLMDADDVEFLSKKGETYNDTDAFCRVGAKEYVMGDLEKILENWSTQEELDKLYKNGVLPERAKFKNAKSFYSYLVWSRDAVGLGIEKKPEYLKELREREINLIMAEYLKAKLSRETIISDQEITEEYESEKIRKYSEKTKENGVIVNRPLPFELVKDEVINDLKEKKGRQIAQDWRKQLFEKYNFMINETELEGS